MTHPATHTFSFHGLVGNSSQIKQVYDILKKIAPYDASVLVEGESGTGKELVARAIHFNSPRKNKEFVVVNCSAFSDSLLESELFGHMRGSFTGAIAEKKGLFEIADRGTFFLDEVGDMSPALQVKLLRVLQEGVFLKIGGTHPVHVDVRIVAATNQDLKNLVAKGKFRDDLYYRLNVIHIVLPPLRERPEDIAPLVESILKKISQKNGQKIKKVSKSALALLTRYKWPGNVRELENELERACILADGDTLESRHLSRAFAQSKGMQEEDQVFETRKKGSLKKAKQTVVKQLEKEMIQAAMSQTQGNQTKAAKELEISRQELIRKIKRYKIA